MVMRGIDPLPRPEQRQAGELARMQLRNSFLIIYFIYDNRSTHSFKYWDKLNVCAIVFFFIISERERLVLVPNSFGCANTPIM